MVRPGGSRPGDGGHLPPGSGILSASRARSSSRDPRRRRVPGGSRLFLRCQPTTSWRSFHRLCPCPGPTLAVRNVTQLVWQDREDPPGAWEDPPRGSRAELSRVTGACAWPPSLPWTQEAQCPHQCCWEEQTAFRGHLPRPHSSDEPACLPTCSPTLSGLAVTIARASCLKLSDLQAAVFNHRPLSLPGDLGNIWRHVCCHHWEMAGRAQGHCSTPLSAQDGPHGRAIQTQLPTAVRWTSPA